MNVTVNQEHHDVQANTSVLQILERFELTGERVAVERNGVIVKKADYASTLLADGDALEVVRFVGGG